jgi:hypothetical protein
MEHVRLSHVTNRNTPGNGVFYAVRSGSYVLESQKAVNTLRESHESAVSCWKADPQEVVADSRPWRKRGRQRSPHFLTRCIVRPSCEIDASQRKQKTLNTEAEETTALNAVTTKRTKTQQTEKL